MLDVAQPTPIDEVVKLTMEPERLGLGDRKETFDCSKVVPTIFKCFLYSSLAKVSTSRFISTSPTAAARSSVVSR